MECQRLVKRIRYLEVGCLACSDVPNLEVLKKKAKKRLLDVKRALQSGTAVPPLQVPNASGMFQSNGFAPQGMQSQAMDAFRNTASSVVVPSIPQVPAMPTNAPMAPANSFAPFPSAPPSFPEFSGKDDFAQPPSFPSSMPDMNQRYNAGPSLPEVPSSHNSSGEYVLPPAENMKPSSPFNSQGMGFNGACFDLTKSSIPLHPEDNSHMGYPYPSNSFPSSQPSFPSSQSPQPSFPSSQPSFPSSSLSSSQSSFPSQPSLPSSHPSFPSSQPSVPSSASQPSVPSSSQPSFPSSQPSFPSQSSSQPSFPSSSPSSSPFSSQTQTLNSCPRAQSSSRSVVGAGRPHNV